MFRKKTLKKPVPTGWRGVMTPRPRPSDFGLSPLADNVDSITQRQRVRLPRISHGIGGGMRVHDDIEMQRLNFLQQPVAQKSHRRQLSLSGSRAMLGLYSALLIAALLIMHVHLRFTIHDLNMQQHALQTVERRLERQSNLLNQQMVSLEDGRAIRYFAVNQLNMVPNDKDSLEVSVASEYKEKYSERAIAQARKQKQADEAALAQGPAARHLWKLADMAIAFAQPRK